MSTNEESLPAGARDLADPTHARRSLRQSLDRRLRRARRQRATSGGRRAVVAATCLLAIGAGGAVAQDRVGSASGSDGPAASQAGYDVKTLQRKLGVTADGVVGPQTRRAIKRFQTRNGLAADGVVGPRTLAALRLSALAPAPSAKAPTPKSAMAAESDVKAKSAQLARIARCESGGDPTAVSSDGRYRGKYQFAQETWESLGGEGDPAEASEDEQDLRAAALMERQGPSAWPVCSKQ